MMKHTTPFLTAIGAFLIGAFWYSPYGLGTLWLAAMEQNMDNANMFVAMAISFVLTNIMAYGMRWLMQKAKVPASYGAGFLFGLTISLLFIISPLGIVSVYSGKKAFLTLWAINAGYQTTFLTMMSTVLAKK